MNAHVTPQDRTIPRQVAARQLAATRLFVCYVEDHQDEVLAGLSPGERLAMLCCGRDFLGWLTLATADLGRLP